MQPGFEHVGMRYARDGDGLAFLAARKVQQLTETVITSTAEKEMHGKKQK